LEVEVMSVSEADIQRRIIAALEKVGRLVVRVHSGKIRKNGTWMRLAPVGFPDLLVVASPPVFIEVKSATGRLSDDQKRVHDKIRRQGGVVAVVRSSAEALAVVVGKVRPEDLETAEVQALLGGELGGGQ
jgi:hypothetical protein